ncbi:hypothetical protein AB3R30_04040 [Leptolyngbyaceae cyanobacterium UHCC 1019]
MVALEWSLLVGVAGLIGFSLIKLARNIQQERRLRDAFYYLLETHGGAITLIQLAATARVDAEPAKLYLETQAKAFSILPDVDGEGNTFYRFPKVQRSLTAAEDDEWA